MLTKFHNVDQIPQLWPNFTILTKFHNFDQISQLWPNFTKSTKFHNLLLTQSEQISFCPSLPRQLKWSYGLKQQRKFIIRQFPIKTFVQFESSFILLFCEISGEFIMDVITWQLFLICGLTLYSIRRHLGLNLTILQQNGSCLLFWNKHFKMGL